MKKRSREEDVELHLSRLGQERTALTSRADRLNEEIRTVNLQSEQRASLGLKEKEKTQKDAQITLL